MTARPRTPAEVGRELGGEPAELLARADIAELRTFVFELLAGSRLCSPRVCPGCASWIARGDRWDVAGGHCWQCPRTVGWPPP
jgi:hypothetical protein